MKCKNCGYELTSDAIFCEKCGTKVETTEEKETVENIEEKKEEIKEEKKVEETKEEIIEEKDESIENKEESIENNLNIDVHDLAPDDIDDLRFKKKNPLVIILIILVIIALVVLIGYLLINDREKQEEKAKNDYQAIIDEYGKEIERVASDYLLDHEIINDFDEISDLVKYNKHKVVCDNVIINIDGTVYLSSCSINGVAVEETYGRKKNIIAKDDACNIITKTDKNVLEFYVDSELISVYECEHDKCGIYEPVNYNSCLDMITVLEDGDEKYLYSYQSAQQLLDPLEDIVSIKKDDKVLGFIYKDLETEKYGYVNTRGIAKLEMKYDTLGLIDNGKIYGRSIDINNNRITASIDDKYGVIDLNTGKEIIPFKYDNIYLGPNNTYVIKEDKKYKYVNASLEKILDKEYNMIFAFDQVIVVNDDNKLIILDNKGNKLIDKELDTYIDYKEIPISGVFGYNVTINDNVLTIEINKSNGRGYDKIKYLYHIDTNSLEAE